MPVFRALWLGVILTLSGCATERATGPNVERPVTGGVLAAATGGRDLGTLGGGQSFAVAVNEWGIVAGHSSTTEGAVHAFRWNLLRGMEDLGTLPGHTTSVAVSILNTGEILGWSGTDDGAVITPVVWGLGGRITRLPIPQLPTATNPDLQMPTSFNVRGEVVGWTFASSGQQGWYWSRQTGTINLEDLIPSCIENQPNEINNFGLVIGSYCSFDGGSVHAFLWRLGQPFHDLGVLGDDPSAFVNGLGLNNLGQAVGWLDDRFNTTPSAFRWTRRDGFTLLPSPPGSFERSFATGINDRGVVVGSIATQAVGPLEVQAVAWPSPNTVVVLDPDPSSAVAVSSTGLAVGGASVGGVTRARIWVVPAPADLAAVPFDISGEGEGSRGTRTALQSSPTCFSDQTAMASKSALIVCTLKAMKAASGE